MLDEVLAGGLEGGGRDGPQIGSNDAGVMLSCSHGSVALWLQTRSVESAEVEAAQAWPYYVKLPDYEFRVSMCSDSCKKYEDNR